MLLYRNKLYFIKFWADTFCLILCYLITALVIKPHHPPQLNLVDAAFMILLFGCWYFTSKSNKLYGDLDSRTLFNDIFKTFYNILIQGMFAGLFSFLIKDADFSRVFIFSYFFLLVIILPFEKALIRMLFANPRKNIAEKRNVVIIGAGKLGMDFYKLVKSNPALGYNVVGVLDDKPNAALNGSYLGKIERLQQLFNDNISVNEVVVALPNTEVEALNRVVSITRNEAVRLRIMPDYSQFISSRYTVDSFGGMAMINARPEPLEDFHWRLLKRIFDITFSFIVLVTICSWLFPLIAILIKLTSKGPVFFKQLRSGRNKVPFYCYKFRSMHVNDDAHIKKATKNDPRITWVGRILRKTNIDEMPQFFNVLIGNMTVVGPRPHMVSQNSAYSKIINQYMVRQLLKPGVTGWAQVCGHRGETKKDSEMQMRVEHDVWYMENWSFKLDIKIIFLTIWNMIKGEEKAY